jgi:hypothetical protein
MKTKIWISVLMLIFSIILLNAKDQNETVPVEGDWGLSNYPNPFNLSGTGRGSSTVISFHVPEISNRDAMELTIYNIKGQKVKKYSISNIQYSISTDEYSVAWDGRDEENNPVTPGIYFYKLKIGSGRSVTKKMLLLR